MPLTFTDEDFAATNSAPKLTFDESDFDKNPVKPATSGLVPPLASNPLNSDTPQLSEYKPPTLKQRAYDLIDTVRRSAPVEDVLGKTPDETAQMLEPRPTGLVPNIVKAAKDIPKVADLSPADLMGDQTTTAGGVNKALLSQINLGNLAMMTGIGEVWKAANLAKDSPKIAALTKALIGAYFSTQGAKGAAETSGKIAGNPSEPKGELGQDIAGIGLNSLMAFAPAGEAILSGKVKPFDRSKIPFSGATLNTPKGFNPLERPPPQIVDENGNPAPITTPQGVNLQPADDLSGLHSELDQLAKPSTQTQNAIPKPSTGEILQRQPEQVGEEGGGRGGVEPVQQGKTPAPAPPQENAEIQKAGQGDEKVTPEIKERLRPKPNWEVNVQKYPAMPNGEVPPPHVQLVDPSVIDEGAPVVATVDSVRAAGHDVPDFSSLPAGKYKWDEAKKLLESSKTGSPKNVPDATGVEKPPVAPAQSVQKYRVGRSPQLFSLVEKLPQTDVEKENGEQAVSIKNDTTGETHVVMETDLKPVTERTVEQKSASKKSSVPEKLKSLGYSDSQIAAMPKAGAKALADRGEPAIVGMGAAVPSEFKADYSRDVYGIAERVRQRRENAEMTEPTQAGKGIAPEASVQRGRQLLKSGVDPEKVMADFEKSNRASSDDFAVVRAHGEVLARITNRTEENFGTNSPEYRAAYKAESDWAARTKAMQTEWAKSGHAQQGEVDIDTGTFSGLKRAYRDAHNGEELPKADEKKAQELADENRRLLNENGKLLKQLGEKLDKETKPKGDIKENPPTPDNVRASLSDYKGGKMTTPQVRSLWNYTKKTYIDKGNADFSDIVNKVSTDLGIPFKDVANGLAQPKGVKKITDELWRKQTDARRVSESAKRWVRQTNSALLGQAVPRIARLMFGAKVFGHGGVAFGTHAPMVAFVPKYWPTYFRDFGKMYKMVFSPAEYEINVQHLRSDPNYTTAQRAGLVNDPYKVEDFNNPDMAQYFGRLSGAGNRGYFALKILRQDMFNKGWDKLSATLRTPEMAKAMADDINHITGVVKSSLGNKASLALFAPRLLASRAAFLAGDPYKAVEAASTAMSPARWKALAPEKKWQILNQVKQKSTIVATAYGLLLANQALLNSVGSKQKINLTDPTKSDFMKFKVAGMDFSYGNAMLNMARLPVRLWTIGAGDGGKLKHVIYPDESMYSAAGEFVRSQASPIASLGLDLVFKGDYQNRPLPQIPGYGAPIPLPKRLAAQGIKPYTWPEFFSEQVLPIPLEEAAREVWRTGFGFTPEQEKSLAKAAGTTIVMMGTGGRLTEDIQPSSNSNSKSGNFPVDLSPLNR